MSSPGGRNLNELVGMTKDIKYYMGAVGLGVSLIVYAQANFTTKIEGKMIYKMVERLDVKMDRVVNFLLKEKK